MDVAQLLGSWGPWQCRLCKSAGGYCHRGYGAIRAFYICDSSAPMKTEHEAGLAAWVMGTLVVPSVQGYGLPQLQELWCYQSFFKPLVAGDRKSLAGLSL